MLMPRKAVVRDVAVAADEDLLAPGVVVVSRDDRATGVGDDLERADVVVMEIRGVFGQVAAPGVERDGLAACVDVMLVFDQAIGLDFFFPVDAGVDARV